MTLLSTGPLVPTSDKETTFSNTFPIVYDFSLYFFSVLFMNIYSIAWWHQHQKKKIHCQCIFYSLWFLISLKFLSHVPQMIFLSLSPFYIALHDLLLLHCQCQTKTLLFSRHMCMLIFVFFCTVFFSLVPPKKYGKPRLGESVNLRWRRWAQIHLTLPWLTFLYLELFRGVPVKKNTQ